MRRLNLGPCLKLHDEKLRKEYQQSDEKDRYNFEAGYFENLQRLVNDLDRKIRRARERIEHKGDEEIERMNQIARDERTERIVLFEEKIKELQAKIEQCAEDGRVDEARELSTEVDALMGQLQLVKSEEAQERRMEICEICGALLVIGDAPERMQSHLDGKQHKGYIRLRAKYDELKPKYSFRPPLPSDFSRSDNTSNFRDDRRDFRQDRRPSYRGHPRRRSRSPIRYDYG